MADLGAVNYGMCACTPRSLMVPAGGVITLHPSQRVSAKELEAKDRAWQRQQGRQSAHNKAHPNQAVSQSALSRQVSYPPSYVSTASQQAQATELETKARPKNNNSFCWCVFGRKSVNKASSKD